MYHKRNECDESVIENNDTKFAKEVVCNFGNHRFWPGYNFLLTLWWAKVGSAELISMHHML